MSMASLFFSVLLLQTLLSTATETITPTTPLSGTHTLVSKAGKFALGFYSPAPQGNGSTTPSPGAAANYYITIWYNNIPKLTPVWTANRDAPVSDPSAASLAISSDGNLVLVDRSKNPPRQLWSTNVRASANTTVAVILDTGSLALTDTSNSSVVYWQSIDHPTNTWLPGGKLGFNKATGVSQRMVAWRNSANPSPGLFSLEQDPNGTAQFFMLWNDSIGYWTSGPWNDSIGQIFSNVPEMTSRNSYNGQFVNNSRESYFTYSMKGSVISRFIIDVNGQIKQLTWVPASMDWILFWSQPKTQCEVYALCGAFGSCNNNAFPSCSCVRGFSQRIPADWNLGDFGGGCKRSAPLQCQANANSTASTSDKFYAYEGVRLPDNEHSAPAAGSSGECRAACLSNCSCTAYAYNSSGCFVWDGDLVNLQEQYTGSAGTLFLRLAASELPDSKKSKAVVIGAVVGSVAALLVVGALVLSVLLVRRCRRRERALRISKAAAGGTLVAFRYSDLQLLTKNFSDKLGGGAFGSVFKGWLPDSTAIAVKRLDGLDQGEKQFRAEVSTIGTIQHVNLVRLLGFCSEGAHRLLVYEFMPNGSLDLQLFPDGKPALSWATRYQIALGTARGLHYLHEKCRDCIIHCDVKPENVLLDGSFVPKVADFGLAKLLCRDFSRVLTTLRGTRGYLAPEWISGVPITAKADVFSYGMMLLELISGRRNSDHNDEEGRPSAFFPTMAATKLHEEAVGSLLDPRLHGDANAEELERACKVACWCIQEDASVRPTMGQLIQILEGFLTVNMPPIPMSLRALGENPEGINFFEDVSSDPTSRTTQKQSTTTSSSSSNSQFESS